jgi:hypothetical protein
MGTKTELDVFGLHSTQTLRVLAVIVPILATGLLLVGNAHSQFVETPRSETHGLTCSRPPCVLPPTQASEGGSIVTDSPLVINPQNSKKLLLGSFDANCTFPLGFHLSTDGGSTWQRVLCMPAIITKQRVYEPGDEPSVGYDRNGNAYAAGIYFGNSSGTYGFLALEIGRWNSLEQASYCAARPRPDLPIRDFAGSGCEPRQPPSQ